jgi:small subunit ribosomal protein S21
MIIVNVKEGESLDRALKRFKKKSVTRRIQRKKAIYKQSLQQENI